MGFLSLSVGIAALFAAPPSAVAAADAAAPGCRRPRLPLSLPLAAAAATAGCHP